MATREMMVLFDASLDIPEQIMSRMEDVYPRENFELLLDLLASPFLEKIPALLKDLTHEISPSTRKEMQLKLADSVRRSTIIVETGTENEFRGLLVRQARGLMQKAEALGRLFSMRTHPAFLARAMAGSLIARAPDAFYFSLNGLEAHEKELMETVYGKKLFSMRTDYLTSAQVVRLFGGPYPLPLPDTASLTPDQLKGSQHVSEKIH